MKKLYRSRRERMICGVCGGIAEYFETFWSISGVLISFVTSSPFK